MAILSVLLIIGMPSPLERIIHRSKRACPYGYDSTCDYGCCDKKNSGCGPSWYPVSTNPLRCRYISCPRGYTACATDPTNCCKITCLTGYITCHGGVSTTNGSTYCCPPTNNICCAFPYTKGGIGGCCSSAELKAASAKASCGYTNQPCCTEGGYGPYCLVGGCSGNGFCLTSG